MARQSLSLQGFKAELFKALAHPTRIRILDSLRVGEISVSELQLRLGIESSSASQQLGVLRAQHIIDGRKEGTSVYYHVRDPKIFELLDLAREIFANQLIDLQEMAEQESVEEKARGELSDERSP